MKYIFYTLIITSCFFVISIDGQSKTKRPRCMHKWENCMTLEMRPSASECDDLINKEFGCPKPKPYYRGKNKPEYDLIINRESVDTDHQEDILHLKYKVYDKTDLQIENKDRSTIQSDSQHRKSEDTQDTPADN